MHRLTTRPDALRGNLVAAVLAGAWRPAPPPLDLSSDQLAQVAPLLLETGAGALAWWRLRNTDLAASPAAQQLHDAYRLHTLQAALHQRQIVQTLTHLRSVGVDPLLVKGWAAARLYPETGLRPYGDIDLYIAPEQRPAADTALRAPGFPMPPLDLHRQLSELDDRTPEELHRRSQFVPLGDVDVRILGAEDHLRYLCLHFLRHGAWRPLWLCDIGATLESLPADFDWDYLLSGDRRRTGWTLCVLALAHRLLGAHLSEALLEDTRTRIPRWLIPSLLRRWEAGHQEYKKPMIAYLRHPAGLTQAIRQRWPNPILASFRRGAPSNRLPGLVVQTSDFAVQTARFVLRRGRYVPGAQR